MECEFCKKILGSLSSLNNHKATAKYCLKIQNRCETFNCTFCDDEFETKNDLAVHTKDCKYLSLSVEIKDKDTTIENLQSRINQLENQLENMAMTTIKLIGVIRKK